MHCIAEGHLSRSYPTEQDRQQIFAEMVRLGFFNAADSPDEVFPVNPRSPQTYLTAPSSHNDFYNAHPGGLAVTVAYNVRMAEAYTANYRQMFGVPINRDLPSKAALCIHEFPKVWLYQWQEDGLGRRNRVPFTMIPGTPIVFTLLLSFCIVGLTPG